MILILLTTGSEAQLGFVANVDHATREQLVQHLTQHPDWIQFVPWRCGEDAVLLIQSLGELVTYVFTFLDLNPLLPSPLGYFGGSLNASLLYFWSRVELGTREEGYVEKWPS